jgi:hypothetical protein
VTVPVPAAYPVPIDLRLRNWIPDAELQAKVGKIVTDRDFNVLCTGPVRLYSPAGPLLGVYLPGVLADVLGAAWPVLSRVKVVTDNRGKASGSGREKRGDQKRSRTRRIISSTLGAVDPGPSVSRTSDRLPACRLTAWTGKHVPEWEGLRPVFQAIAKHYQEWAPHRWARQAQVASATHPEWVIPGTPFTTVTLNNTYATGVHQDAGDYPEGFSTLAVARRGDYQGGYLVWPRYRVAFDLRDGDLLVFDAHEWHGNTNLTCPHVDGPLERPCPEGCERISLVSYFRTKVQQCGTADEEYAKVLAASGT